MLRRLIHGERRHAGVDAEIEAAEPAKAGRQHRGHLYEIGHVRRLVGFGTRLDEQEMRQRADQLIRDGKLERLTRVGALGGEQGFDLRGHGHPAER